MKPLHFVLFFCSLMLFSQSGFAKERQHTLKLKNAKVSELTVEQLIKDIPQLKRLKTSLQKEEVQEFEGVSFADFIKIYGPEKFSKVKLTATNDYAQTLTASDWNDWGAVLAFRSNGKLIPTKSRGTFRIVYDYNRFKDDKEILLKLETNSVWQVVHIEFIP